MLTKGFKNEEQKKLDQLLNAGLQLAFVPESWKLKEKQQFDELLLRTAEVSLEDITRLPTKEFIEILKKHRFSFSNLERFADLLMNTLPVEPENRIEIARKAEAIYEFAQEESKTYSLGLIQKLKEAKEEAKR